MPKKKVVHIIVGLNVGGAETMLFKLLKNADRKKYEFKVISMMDEGIFGGRIKELGIPVHSLGMKKGIPNPIAIKRAKSIVKDADILQTWMYHADLFGFLIRSRSRSQKLIWGIRHSNLDKDANKKMLLYVARLNAALSKYVNLIISCSKTASIVHGNYGYDTSKMLTIPNGFELDTFYKYVDAKSALALELQMPLAPPLIAHVGRWEVQKDYPNLIQSIKFIHQKRPEAIFLLCGKGIDAENKELRELMELNGVNKNVFLLGRREDIPKILSAADLLISSSLGEGFSNVIGEAMACETPCVVTDVGDSAYIVGSHGLVVPPQNAEMLAEAVINFLNKTAEEKAAIGQQARQRVISEFDINKVVKKFEEQYEIK
ncbi:glycosyltransferase [Domibacillus aminovorans]|uniref:glycosyltransferase n=1 Tax=Domibacillus aminovorans TaxID=29332 RepID=UPI003D23B70A